MVNEIQIYIYIYIYYNKYHKRRIIIFFSHFFGKRNFNNKSDTSILHVQYNRLIVGNGFTAENPCGLEIKPSMQYSYNIYT